VAFIGDSDSWLEVWRHEVGLRRRINALEHTTDPPSNPEEQSIPQTVAAPQQGRIIANSSGAPNPSQNQTDRLAREFRTVEIIQIVVSVALGIIGVIALFIYYGQLDQMRKSTEASTVAAVASRSAAETAHDALAMRQRPWIGISGELKVEKMEFVPNTIQPHDLEPNALNLDVSYTLDNWGAGPARKVSAGIGAIVSNDPDPPATWRKMACDVGELASKSETIPTFFILPKSPVATSSKSHSGIPQKINEVRQVWLVGCFVYQDIFGGLHHTKLLFRSVPVANTAPITRISNPKLTATPFSGFQAWDSDTD
jgi:hypothetical protein